MNTVERQQNVADLQRPRASLFEIRKCLFWFTAISWEPRSLNLLAALSVAELHICLKWRSFRAKICQVARILRIGQTNRVAANRAPLQSSLVYRRVPSTLSDLFRSRQATHLCAARLSPRHFRATVAKRVGIAD